MQSLSSLVFLMLTIVVLTVQWILPILNLHIALNQEHILLERAQSIVDATRLNPSNALSDLRSLVVSGINIRQVAQTNQGDYVLYQIEFNHRGLFTNRFLTQEQLESSRTLTLLSDRQL